MSRTIHGLMSLAGLLLLGGLLLLAEGCFSPAPHSVIYQETALPLERISAQILDSVEGGLATYPQSREAHLLQKFYQANEGHPAWINRRGVSFAAWQLLAVLEGADREGLSPARYGPSQLRSMLRPPVDEMEDFLGWPPREVARTDVALSRAFFRYAGDNLRGQERSWRSRGDWHRPLSSVDPALLLDLALELDALPSALQGLLPAQKGYRQLRQMLKFYRELAALGGWTVIDDGETLHPGESNPRVSQLRRRLQLEGDLRDDSAQREFFDPVLQKGLQLFQQRYGLTPDGILGAHTLQVLNTPIELRIDKILRNMERWRWVPDQGHGAEIRINLAAFSLEVIEGNHQQLKMPVVIGRQERATPLFSSQLEAMVFTPYWYVPPTLLREALPRIAADPSYLRRNHYEVLNSAGKPIRVRHDFWRKWQRGEVEASLRQQPGPWNPMGRIKFLLPNSWSIYLHDTPRKQLFSREQRAFSSGCVRLSNPQQLARWLLKRSDWDEPRIASLFTSGSSHMIGLEKPVALNIGYWTAWVDESGRINFRDDVYGRDLRLARELHQNPPHLSFALP